MSFITEELLYKKSPQELTMLLYEACERNIEEAITFINRKDYIQANNRFQRAMDILERLGTGLNYEAGIIADELDSLYDYMRVKIREANLYKNKEPASKALKILRKISSSWVEALRSQTDKQSKLSRIRTNAYEQNVMYDS